MKNHCPIKRILLVLAVTFFASFIGRAQTVLTIYYPIPEPASNTWTSYSVPLNENAGWTIGSPGGQAPSQSQLQEVLKNLNTFTIQFGSGSEAYMGQFTFDGLVSSTFLSCNTDGWMDMDARGTGCNSSIGSPPTGAISAYPTGAMEAPAKYLCDESAAYGGSLVFDLMELSSAGTGYVKMTSFEVTNSKAGIIYPWGDNNSGQYIFPAGFTNVIGITAGRFHSVALNSAGLVATCGWNTYSTPDFLLPGPQLSASQTNVPAWLSNVVSVACGHFHSLALRADGTVVAWGNNTFNQTNVPAGLSNVVAIAGGGYHSLALKSDGTVVCWGATNVIMEDGRTNNAAPNYGQSFPPSNLSNIVAVAAGGYYSLALSANGTVITWGGNEGAPTNVPAGLTNVIAIAAGYEHNLALTAGGNVVAWGSDTYGQTNVPPGLSNVVAISAGTFYSMALKSDGTIVSWGSDEFSQTNVPASLTNAVAIAAGGYHSLSLIGSGPPQVQTTMLPVLFASNSFAVLLPTQSGHVYQLEYKNSLTDANWTALPLIAGTGMTQAMADNSGMTSQRFYRVRRW